MRWILIPIIALSILLYGWYSFAFYHNTETIKGGSGGGGEVVIHSPKDESTVEGDTLKVTFEIVDKGSMGDHMHIFLDDKLLKPVYGTSYTIKGLTRGEHTIEVKLTSKNHVLLGPSAEIEVYVK